MRGGFVGGTFGHEARAVLAARGLREPQVELVDFGDDEYTAGRPHPMIEPSLRDRWIGEAIGDPATSVVLLDVVLGLGAHPRPIDGLLKRIGKRAAANDPPVIAHVCGTDLDPQGREQIRDRLADAGVYVAESNAEASSWAADVDDAAGGPAAGGAG